MLNKIKSPDRYFTTIQQHDHIICFGAGSKGRQSLPLLREKGIEPTAFCDNNPALWGTELEPGLPVLSLEEVRKRYSSYCIVMTVAQANACEIRTSLRKQGETGEIYHVMNPFKVDNALLSWQTFRDRLNDFKRVANLFIDEESSALYAIFLEYKMTGNILPLFDHFADSQQNSFFDATLLPARRNHVYVDVGAYTGDTIMRFLLFSQGKYAKILGFEPDTSNYTAALDFVRYSRMPDIEVRNLGLWSSQEKRPFYTLGKGNHQHYDSPNFYQDVIHAVDTRFHSCMATDGRACEEKFVSTLDTELGDLTPTIMKVNALAADLEVLKGGADTIRRHRPAIIMEYGCRPEYILETPNLLLSFNPNYRFFLRQKEIFGDSKTILYAV